MIGLLVGLPSRRLAGDYLAIVTLFFLQLFQTLTTNGDNAFGHNVTGGPFGLLNVDPYSFFGHDLTIQHQGVFATSYLYLALAASWSSTSRCGSSIARAPAGRGARFAKTRSPPRPWACRSTG